MLTTRRRLVLLALTTAFSLSSGAVAHAQALSGATVTVVGGGVEVSRGGEAFVPLLDGELLRVGDVLRTAPDAQALITFFDGSETLLNGSLAVAVREATDPALEQRAASVFQAAGLVLTRLLPGDDEPSAPGSTSVGMVRG